MNYSPSDIVIKDRFRKDVDKNIHNLAASIKLIGQIHPVLINSEDELICGARRVRACELLGIDVIVRKVLTLDDAVKHLIAERDENTCREDFTPTEAVALGKELEKLEKPKAEERRRSTQNNDAAREACGGNLPQQETGKTRDKVAAAVGMSGKTYEKAKAVVEAAAKPDAPPEVKQAKEDMDRTGKVDPAFKAVTKSGIKSEFDLLKEKIEKAMRAVEEMAASRLGHTPKSKAVLEHLSASVKAAEAWRRSVEKK